MNPSIQDPNSPHFNDRQLGAPEALRRRLHLLLKFPEEPLEAVVVQWSHCRPTVLVQLRENPEEPLQFPDKKKASAPQLDSALRGFVNPASGRPFEGMGFNADLLFSLRVFASLQPEPDRVLPLADLVECRAEALRALQLADEPLPIQSGSAELPN